MKTPFVCLGVAWSIAVAAAAPAATFQVTRFDDDNGACTADDCALREAILAANAAPDADTIVLSAGRYLLSIPGFDEDQSRVGDLDILAPLTIEGSPLGKSIVDGGNYDGNIDIFSPGGPVVLRRLVITGGGSQPGFSVTGAGIYSSDADLTIEDCEIVGNQGFEAGGLRLVLGSTRIERSLIADNVAELRGGGIYTSGSSQVFPVRVTLVNSTVTGNVAGMGGGISIKGDNEFDVINSTVAGNDAFPGSAFDLEFSGTADLRFRNSIVQGTCSYFQGGAPATFGGNLESPGDTCVLHDPTDRVSVARLGLAPLDWNGGRTRTRALVLGSPAIDFGPAACEATDQRGQSRPFDGDGDGEARCDAGAFELAPEGLVVEVPALSPPSLIALGLLLAVAGALRLRT